MGGGRWWDQPNDMFPKDLILDDDERGGGDQTVAKMEELRRLLSQPLRVVDTSIHNGGTWLKPTTLEELLDLFREYSSSNNNHSGSTAGGLKLVVGNTEVGIETKFKHAMYPRLVHPSENIHTLYDIFATENYFFIGGCASLSRLQKFCHGFMVTDGEDAAAGDNNRDGARRRTAAPIYNMLRWFASTQIRNVACLGGNLATASPISDMNPLLCSLGATLVLASRPKPDGGIARRHVSVPDFFLRYRTVDKTDMEIIERVDVPLVQSFEYVAPFKQARRREDDISIVTSGMRIKLSPETDNGDGDDRMQWIIRDVSIAFGGMAPVTKLAKETMEFMVGKPFRESTFADAQSILRHEFSMPDDVPGGQAQYRLTLACR